MSGFHVRLRETNENVKTERGRCTVAWIDNQLLQQLCQINVGESLEKTLGSNSSQPYYFQLILVTKQLSNISLSVQQT